MNAPANLLQCRVRFHDGSLKDFGVCTPEEVLDHFDEIFWDKELVAMEALKSAGRDATSPRMHLRNNLHGSLAICPQEDETVSVRYNCIEQRKILGFIPASKIHKHAFDRLSRHHLDKLLTVFSQGIHRDTLNLLEPFSAVPRRALH